MKPGTRNGLRTFCDAVLVAGVTVLLCSIWMGAATPAGADPAATQLSIAIDNGHTATKVGDQLHYETVVENLGEVPVSRLVLTQTMPDGLDFATADAGGRLSDGVVTWRVRVPAGGHVTVHTSGEVTETMSDTLRLASVACATTKAGKPPVVCATHSDELPAGAAAAAAGQDTTPAEDNSGTGWLTWAVLGGLVLVGAGSWAAHRLVGRRRSVAAAVAKA
jgi:uncharacterized repeat protein (TIGR01451 family)